MEQKISKIVAVAEQLETLKATNQMMFIFLVSYILIFLLSFAIYIKGFSLIVAGITMYKYIQNRKEIKRLRDKYEL